LTKNINIFSVVWCISNCIYFRQRSLIYIYTALISYYLFRSFGHHQICATITGSTAHPTGQCKGWAVESAVNVQRQHNITSSYWTNQYFCINICLLYAFATCFDPAGSPSGKYSWNAHSYLIVLLIWIHISRYEYKFHYYSCFITKLNISLKL
jgi:hypothetical protein